MNSINVNQIDLNENKFNDFESNSEFSTTTSSTTKSTSFSDSASSTTTTTTTSESSEQSSDSILESKDQHRIFQFSSRNLEGDRDIDEFCNNSIRTTKVKQSL